MTKTPCHMSRETTDFRYEAVNDMSVHQRPVLCLNATEPVTGFYYGRLPDYNAYPHQGFLTHQ